MSFDDIKLMLAFMWDHENTEITYTFRKKNQPVATVRLKNVGIIQMAFSQLPSETKFYEDIDEAASVINKLIN